MTPTQRLQAKRPEVEVFTKEVLMGFGWYGWAAIPTTLQELTLHARGTSEAAVCGLLDRALKAIRKAVCDG